MARHHEGMKHEGMNKGRADMKASAGGHEMFGKSGGGSPGVHTKLYSSPMSSKTVPKFGQAAAKGKVSKQGQMSNKKGY